MRESDFELDGTFIGFSSMQFQNFCSSMGWMDLIGLYLSRLSMSIDLIRLYLSRFSMLCYFYLILSDWTDFTYWSYETTFYFVDYSSFDCSSLIFRILFLVKIAVLLKMSFEVSNNSDILFFWFRRILRRILSNCEIFASWNWFF